MGIKSFFSRENRHARGIAKLARTVANPKAAGEDRWAAMLDLAKDGTSEAIHALLCRYTYTAEVGTRSRVTDEQEKTLVYDLITERGESALSEVRKFLLSEEGPSGAPKQSISFALRILDKISPDQDTTWDAVAMVIEANEPGYERDPSRKIETLTFLGEWKKDPRVTDAILGYLDDADEGVRFHTAEALLKQGFESCKAPLLMILEEQDESYQMRNRILSGFIDNGWISEIDPFLENLDEPGLMQAVESLVNLPDANAARDPLVRVAEAKHASERVKSRAAEWFVITGASTHGMRGRLEKVLPKGYKVAKKRVDRFPEAMREPYITLAIDTLIDANDPESSFAALIRLIRNSEISESVYVRTVEFLAMRQWTVDKQLEKAVRKALPKGYGIDGGTIRRIIEEMDEPFLTAAGDNLLDFASDQEDEAVEQLIEILINYNSDERVRDRILDRFDREEWSVLGFHKEIERRLPKEFKIHVVNHGQEYRIVRVLARI
ncbi:MAG: hypothetical protein ABI333_05010 [bacterium]